MKTLAEGVLGNRCKYQETIACSCTEAGFTAACDAGKLILYFRSLLAGMNFKQPHASILYTDNNGTLLTANEQQPTQ